MSENANCVEQREEQAELEEAGGAEVSWFLTGIPSARHRVSFTKPHTHVCNSGVSVPYQMAFQISLCGTFTSVLK